MIPVNIACCVIFVVSPLIPGVLSTAACLGLEMERQVFVVVFLLAEGAPEL